jgi:glycine/D-amino acid oxidase-like deaminating enzyme
VGDPDTSWRNLTPPFTSQQRLLAQRFPAMANAPVLETRSCHYEGSVNRNFIIDQHPDMDNVWIAGAGNSEGFKFGPVIGEYTAKRILGRDEEPQLAAHFRMPTEEYDTPA